MPHPPSQPPSLLTRASPSPRNEPKASPDTDPRILILSPRDNVGVAIRDLPAGGPVRVRGVAVTFPAPVPLGHKIALGPIPAGAKIIKYAAPIGSSLREIAAGEHVHTHNMKSDYLPPFGREGSGRMGSSH